jgi:hypothetical protein
LEATSKKLNAFVFFCSTILFVASRFILFNGFNGSDDLHYAMLASKMIKGGYNPFEPNDIFSGRLVLITWQMLIYRFGGISIFTTVAGNIAVVIISCLLTVYKILSRRNAYSTLLCCCLFYFSPRLAADITGISPDPYILLASVCIIIFVKKDLNRPYAQKGGIKSAILTGALIAVSLLVKETALIFLPFVIAVYLYRGKQALPLIATLLLSFTLVVSLFAFGYYRFTGDPFFKINQIKNSAYPNVCNFAFQPLKQLLIRITYGIWQRFIVLGFYPCILGLVVLSVKFIKNKNLRGPENQDFVLFALLLGIGTYFPFSLTGYQPLCATPRQFMFIVPLAAAVITRFLADDAPTEQNKRWLVISFFLVLLACMCSTQNKWQWMIYTLFFIVFCSQLLFRLPPRIHFIFLPLVLFASNFETLFFKNTRWFKDMVQLNSSIKSDYYYFPDHDNMMHWELLNQFNDTTTHYYDLDVNTYKVFREYYQTPDTLNFKKGWFIVNRQYTSRPGAFIYRVDSLQRAGFFSDCKTIGNIGAFLLDNAKQYHYIKCIVNKE